jgi:hypothetical protein
VLTCLLADVACSLQTQCGDQSRSAGWRPTAPRLPCPAFPRTSSQRLTRIGGGAAVWSWEVQLVFAQRHWRTGA